MKTARLFLLFSLTVSGYAQTVATSKEVEAVYPAAHDLYIDLHQTPELSSHETQTASKLAAHLRSLGYEVTEGVGGTGVVAILKNGAGPTVMLRTELDALPVEEKTGLSYASKVHAKDDSGRDVPIVIAARTILALQTIVSREVKPGEMAVVTVGYIRAGTKNNIIPDQAELGLTVRTYKADVRKQVLTAITRIAKAEALAGGAPQEPLIEHYESTDSVFNDPALAERLRAPLEAVLGKQNVITTESITPSEDYAFFIEQGVPSLYLSLGGADPQKYAESKLAGTLLPSNHSPHFAPDVDPALHTGIKAEVAVLRKLLNATPQ